MFTTLPQKTKFSKLPLRQRTISTLFIFLIVAATIINAQYEITASSWISGSGSTDYTTGTAIKSNGVINVAAVLGDARPVDVQPLLLNGATEISQGGVLQLSPNGESVISLTIVADKILDIAMDAQENIYLAAGNAGIIKLSPNADEVLWTAPNGGFCRRLDVGTDGTVIGLNGDIYESGTCYIYDSEGTEIASFVGWRRTQDVAIKSEIGRIYQTGYKNNNSGCNPVQVAYLRCLDYSGTEIWLNYDWPGTWLDNCDGDGWTNLMADTRGYRVTVGRDGLLYSVFEAAGGNHIFSREPKDLKKTVPIVGGDMFFEWYNTKSEHKTFVGRYDPENGDYLLGQQVCNRFWDGSSAIGNTIRVEDGCLAVDENGRVYFGGWSASGLPFNPTHATTSQSYTAGTGQFEFNPFPMTAEDNIYSGGAFLIILSSDFSKRLYCTRLSGGNTYAVDARILSGKSQASLAWGGAVEPLNMDWQRSNRKEQVLHTVNPFQANRSGGSSDGFIAVIGNGGSPTLIPITSIDPESVPGKLEIRFSTEVGMQYQLKTSDSLLSPSWLPLQSPVLGSGSVDSILIDSPNEDQVFFLIEAN